MPDLALAHGNPECTSFVTVTLLAGVPCSKTKPLLPHLTANSPDFAMLNLLLQHALMAYGYCRWFHFRLTGAAHQNLTINLVNAGQSSFPEAWPGYRACASYDLKEWFRVKTFWDEKAGVITVKHKPLQVWLANFLHAQQTVSFPISVENYRSRSLAQDSRTRECAAPAVQDCLALLV